jgi:hypothetical protein
MKTLCFALAIAAMATPVAAGEQSADDIEWKPLVQKAQPSDQTAPGTDRQFTIYGSYRSKENGVAANASTTNGKKWLPVIDVSVGAGF